VFAAIRVSNDFKAILQALEGWERAKFIDITQKFKIFIQKKYNKIRSSPNLESYMHMRIKNNIGGWGCFLLINKLQPKIIYSSAAQTGRA